MIIEISTKQLTGALTKVQKTLPSSSHIPVLNMIKICATDSVVTFTTDDSKNSTSYEVPVGDGESVSIEQEGSVLVPKVFMEMVKKLGKGVRIEVRNNTTSDIGKLIKICSTDEKINSQIELQGLCTDEYPISISTNEKPTLTMSGAVLTSMIKRTVFAASTNESMAILTGVHICIKNGSLNFTSTDRHRLAFVSTKVDTIEELGNGIVVPASVLDDFSKVVNEEDSADLYFLDNKFIVKTGCMTFCTTVIEGIYPDTSKILVPKDQAKYHFILNRKEFIASLERINLIAKGTKRSAASTLTIQPAAESILVEDDNSDVGKIKEEIFVKGLIGEVLKVCYNTEYMIKALEAKTTPNVHFSFTSNVQPIVIRPDDEDDLDYQIILPFRSSN
ncbi:DNA polymerase III subunit beta [Paenibacillus sp. Leaf72]|uniref:DNA polymerase III subunit beta n=1 Tax=Paenibacillus sp. Leaf72 TaxID=1736234 RepID=UPI0006F87271|nr:DNA polymerase III subunit beta [Paenibacillus sp. Leaf72]KQN96844.1 hypothetical protein ASF12_22500 [Paenibacillus sp. Leaf72]